MAVFSLHKSLAIDGPAKALAAMAAMPPEQTAAWTARLIARLAPLDRGDRIFGVMRRARHEATSYIAQLCADELRDGHQEFGAALTAFLAEAPDEKSDLGAHADQFLSAAASAVALPPALDPSVAALAEIRYAVAPHAPAPQFSAWFAPSAPGERRWCDVFGVFLAWRLKTDAAFRFALLPETSGRDPGARLEAERFFEAACDGAAAISQSFANGEIASPAPVEAAAWIVGTSGGPDAVRAYLRHAAGEIARAADIPLAALDPALSALGGSTATLPGGLSALVGAARDIRRVQAAVEEDEFGRGDDLILAMSGGRVDEALRISRGVQAPCDALIKRAAADWPGALRAASARAGEPGGVALLAETLRRYLITSEGEARTAALATARLLEARLEGLSGQHALDAARLLRAGMTGGAEDEGRRRRTLLLLDSGLTDDSLDPLDAAEARALAALLRCEEARVHGAGPAKENAAAAAIALCNPLLSDPFLRAELYDALGGAIFGMAQKAQNPAQYDIAAACFAEAAAQGPGALAPALTRDVASKLGGALEQSAVVKKSPRKLRQASAAYAIAISLWDEKANPLEWGDAQAKRGGALVKLARQGDDAEALAEAEKAFRAAAATHPPSRPFRFATTTCGLAETLIEAGKRERRREAFEEAAEAARAVVGLPATDAFKIQRARAQLFLGEALGGVAELTGDPTTLRDALTALSVARDSAASANAPWLIKLADERASKLRAAA
ncbi:MAG: hypothetical protein NW215_02485 [Hyphomicrobiales bacterium]|nr:hypothetical protein [Hyphomicrobiales bacterium]